MTQSTNTPSVNTPAGLTDLANAGRFAEGWGDIYRFCHVANCWFTTDGPDVDGLETWQPVEGHRLDRIATIVADDLWDDIENDAPRDVVKFARYTSSLAGITAMLRLARSVCQLDKNVIRQHNGEPAA